MIDSRFNPINRIIEAKRMLCSDTQDVSAHLFHDNLKLLVVPRDAFQPVNAAIYPNSKFQTIYSNIDNQWTDWVLVTHCIALLDR